MLFFMGFKSNEVFQIEITLLKKLTHMWKNQFQILHENLTIPNFEISKN